MAKIDTLFKSAGICTHANANTSITKVRFGTDYVRRVKLLSTPGNVKVRGAGLDPVRVELVELPTPMAKAEALEYIRTHSAFQSAEDQALIADEIAEREPKAAREVKVKVAKAKAKPSLDSIKARGRKAATVADVLAAVAETQADTTAQ
jgi:hypothetical protein